MFTGNPRPSIIVRPLHAMRIGEGKPGPFMDHSLKWSGARCQTPQVPVTNFMSTV